MTIQTRVGTPQNNSFRHYDKLSTMETPVVTHSHTKLIGSVYDHQVAAKYSLWYNWKSIQLVLIQTLIVRRSQTKLYRNHTCNSLVSIKTL
jgi:hypothetical protein